MAKHAFVLMLVVGLMCMLCLQSSQAALTPRAPNFQYFERPRYRYPFYDENGRGRLVYGYGGPDLYEYKRYSPLEGIH